MNRNLLPAGLLLLLAPLASAVVDPIMPPPPLPEWTPTDATGYGVGTGLMAPRECGGAVTETSGFDLVLFDLTATRGIWSATYAYHNPLAFVIGCPSALVYSPINLDSPTFDPASGGCFGRIDPWDGSELCLTLTHIDPVTGVHSYDLQEAALYDEGDRYYDGSVEVVFADLPDF